MTHPTQTTRPEIPPLYPTPLTWLYVALAIGSIIALVVGFR